MLAQLFQNPVVFLVMLVEFMLGFGLGYFSVRALKYILALIAILVAGIVLNIWSLGLSLESLLGGLGEYAGRAKDLLMGLAGALGLLAVGPVMIGFLIGVIVAAVRGK